MTVSGSPTTARTTGGWRHGAAVAHRWVLLLLLVDLVVQFFLAGLGAFGGGFDAHLTNGFVVLPALALVVVVLALLARAGTRDVVLALVLLLLLVVGQSLFRALADDGAFWGGLHALDGLVVLGITGFLHGSAVRRTRAVPGA
ncbi:hypothetical protein GCM10027451_14680 [Geodermatophilus aquaeductus]|uniref:Uncharacterized protein n=1 Tax=Geodermatophilus aquaeductus TaxID=1564161 RepID=A0A521BHP2_9ACTN|nr:DUF6220 domain-containing protein [Geodermatophilus aquaeductus]SMO46559.1 hypothetical protein SAMN06273567_101763 [Geodermatophilus aquaeductus]